MHVESIYIYVGNTFNCRYYGNNNVIPIIYTVLYVIGNTDVYIM